MKRRILSLSLVISLITSVFLWLSCGKSVSNVECVKCKPATPNEIKTITWGSRSLKIGLFEKSGFPNLVLSKSQTENKESSLEMLNSILFLDEANSLQGLLENKYIPVNFNLFIKKDLKQNSSFSNEDITGISIFMYKEYGLHHFIFLRNELGKLAIDNKYSVTTDDLDIKDKKLIFQKLIDKSNGSENFTLISMVVPPYNDVVERVNSRNYLRPILKSIKKSGIIGASFREGGDVCDAEVCPPIQDESGKCVERIGGWHCKEITDRNCVIYAVSSAVDKLSEFYTMTAVFYYMRDSILAQSTNGLNIIEKYETASPYIADSIGSLDKNTMYSFITLLYDKTEFLINNPTSTTVLIDSATASDMQSMISDMRSFSSDYKWDECLDFFETLITNFTNEPASDIYTYITS